ncbi:MAG: type 1 glutamine amidotransferase [Planctomycetota bacterium]|nr:type 1 glutamine amidotransferase [Planctomycetota bacterium]MDP6989827.1 type 1 glutamine amidotransferase [Planctomycetota bacterium]
MTSPRSALPYLIVDCYLDELGAAQNLVPLLDGRPSTIVRAAFDPAPVSAEGFAGILLTGSAASILDPLPWIEPVLALLRDAADREVPVFGICFGHQAIARALLGPEAVRAAVLSEIGWAEIELSGEDPLLEGLERRFVCFLSHFDEVSPPLDGWEVLARSERCPVQAFRVPGKPIWAVQFHPEMPPEESERLVRRNLARHAYRGEDPEPVLAQAVDRRDLGERLVARFVDLAETWADPRRQGREESV